MNYGDFNVGSDGRGPDQITSWSMVEVPIHGVSNPAKFGSESPVSPTPFVMTRGWWTAGSEAPSYISSQNPTLHFRIFQLHFQRNCNDLTESVDGI